MQLSGASCGTSPTAAGFLTMAAVLSSAWVGTVQAQATLPVKTTVAVKALDYLDSQPGASRVRVQAASAALIQPIDAEWAFNGSATVDSISGASPYLQSAVLTRLKDQRRAADAQFTRYSANGSWAVGANISTENDYLSRGWSSQVTRSDGGRNTTWTFGLAYNDDVINPVNRIVRHEGKRVGGLLIGLTQVLTPYDLAQINFTRTSSRGYHSDPYKFADERPRRRDADTLMLRWNHHLPSSGITWRSHYRFFRDDWGVRAHTLGAEVVLPAGPQWSFMPLTRLYRQSAASFYVPPNASSYPFAPFEPGPYSEDQRLGAFGAITLGLKVMRRFDENWSADLKIERYEQRTAWAASSSAPPGVLPFQARSVQLGVARSF